MLAEWSAECGPDDPVLVVPWSAPADTAEPSRAAADDADLPHFIDLRESPYDLDLIPEAEQHPPLRHALRALNAARSPVFTAKCDAWPMDEEEHAASALNLDLAAETFPCGFASYLDLVWRDRPIFVSLHQQSQRLDRLVRLLDPLAHEEAAVECVLRPALIDLIGPQEGFAVTLYVKALGATAPAAYQAWSLAFEAVVAVLRSREFTAV